jgi:hypothetical protein
VSAPPHADKRTSLIGASKCPQYLPQHDLSTSLLSMIYTHSVLTISYLLGVHNHKNIFQQSISPCGMENLYIHFYRPSGRYIMIDNYLLNSSDILLTGYCFGNEINRLWKSRIFITKLNSTLSQNYNELPLSMMNVNHNYEICSRRAVYYGYLCYWMN